MSHRRRASQWGLWVESGGHACARLCEAIADAVLELEAAPARRRRRGRGARRRRQLELRVIPNLPSVDARRDAFDCCPYCGDDLGSVRLRRRRRSGAPPVVPSFLPEVL